MCKMYSRKEFSSAKSCKRDLKQIINSEPAKIIDNLLSQYDREIIKLVLAATVLTHNTVLNTSYLQTIQDWAKKYEDKIGFLKSSIGLNVASVSKIQQLIYLINKK